MTNQTNFNLLKKRIREEFLQTDKARSTIMPNLSADDEDALVEVLASYIAFSVAGDKDQAENQADRVGLLFNYNDASAFLQASRDWYNEIVAQSKKQEK